MTRPFFFRSSMAFLCAWAIINVASLEAQSSSRKAAERLLEIPVLDELEAAAFIERFRNTRLASDFVFDFQLKHIPARGRPTVYSGLLAGTWNEHGPQQRVDLVQYVEPTPRKDSWLLNGGREPSIYTRVSADVSEAASWNRVEEDSIATDFLIQAVPITAFDLQFPFVYWEDAQWIRGERVLGRPAQIFDVSPLLPVMSTAGVIARVRLYIDADFSALLRAEYFDASGNLLRQLKVLSFKEVLGQWIPNRIDFIDRGSREKVRFEVKSAALDIVIPETLFDSSLPPSENIDIPNLTFERL